VLLGLSLASGRFTRVGEHTETTLEWRTPQGRPCSPPDAGADGGAGDAGVADCAQVPVTKRVAPPKAPVAGIADGKILVGWAAGCAFGPVVAGAVLTMETGYTGVRTGDFDPPPYTPAPVLLPDAGIDDDGQGDAGAP
jgi:hypothetical protein